MTRSSRAFRALGAALVACGLASPAASANPLAVHADDRALAGPADARPPVGSQLAPKSRLPHPANADLWVDAEGAPTVSVAGVIPSPARRLQILVYRPEGDNMALDQVAALFEERGYLNRRDPGFAVQAVPRDGQSRPDANVEETRVFNTPVPRQFLVLGSIRNVRTRNQLIYAVLVSGAAPAVDLIQTLTLARAHVNQLALAEKGRRSLPPPPGAVPAAPTDRRVGVQLRELQQAFERNSGFSPRVRELARTILPQASGVTLATWRTARPMADEEFIAYYTEQAEKLGWGAPVTTDTTQPTRPTLLFQRPRGEGVVMVRAQPTTFSLPGGRTLPATNLFVLLIEGEINLAAPVVR